ncbi:antitoxin [uncultured Amnibacterium sp.]|uniref:antitoxin n=1 Tax=uncultured Amnibacterium sp. TaxID=1631851 RepID=UPI0035CA3F02
MSGIGDKANDFLHSDKGEQASDGALDKAGDAADRATGGGHDEQIDTAREAADQKLGD